MKRLLTHQLIDWQKQETRKPLLLDGARQVGKSYLVEHIFGQAQFRTVHKLDFLADRTLATLFEDSLEADAILAQIEIRFNVGINLQTDLIFFDEVGECQGAVNSLKYFAEKLPIAYVCASGSNIGLLGSFPVGKVHLLELFPFNFEEFLMASGKTKLLKAFRRQALQKSVHDQLWAMLLDYYFVGGMPEAVGVWFDAQASVNERCRMVKEIHKNLIAGYVRDFGKYSGKINAQHIESVFLNVPRQLSKNQDGSVKRFAFKNIVEKKRRYNDIRDPIAWLEKSKLISKCHPISSQPTPPLTTLAKENIFKIFFFDVGLLGYLLEMEYVDQLAQKINYKGYIAENFVQNELRVSVCYPTYSWERARSEIEFIIYQGGEVIPVEVKSGSRTRAKSLSAYIARYAPAKTVKLVGAAVGGNDDNRIVWPLYYAQYLRKL